MRWYYLVLLVWVAFVYAEDPASDWLAYAEATNPSGVGRITYIEAYWVVPQDPTVPGGFFSPWFGIESSDNLNLIQPVNPWSDSYWEIYNEYFQWEPEHNFNSVSHKVKAGDTLFGSVSFNEANQTYSVYHSDLNNTWSVVSNIEVQKEKDAYKNYTIAYFVFEKVNECKQYPPNNQVTFTDIRIDYDYQTVTPSWNTSYVVDHCDCRASILSETNNITTVQITWES